MHYLYGLKQDMPRRLIATFSSEAQLRAYVAWATLKIKDDGTSLFEQKTPMAGYSNIDFADTPLTDEDETRVLHNPTPSML